MTLQEKIEGDYKEALKARDEIRVSTLRMLKAAILNALIDKKKLSDEDFMDIIVKPAKQREDSIESFQKGNRADLVEKEKKELAILSSYLPKQLSKGEVEIEVAKAIHETGASSKAQMGQVMKFLMERLKGRADNRLISQIVSQKLFL